MLYQFFAGRPPFKAVNEFLIFQLIQARNFIYPENFPDVARDLIDQLLVFFLIIIVIGFLCILIDIIRSLIQKRD